MTSRWMHLQYAASCFNVLVNALLADQSYIEVLLYFQAEEGGISSTTYEGRRWPQGRREGGKRISDGRGGGEGESKLH